jgi:acyl-CoA synthetase (AMP-forming)/AMP-acid ligase II
VGVPDEAKGELVVAFVCLSNNKKTVSEFELKEFCKDQIASYKVPARIMVMTKPLPRTDTGKLSRKTVRDMAKELML